MYNKLYYSDFINCNSDFYREIRNEGSTDPPITCTSDDAAISGIFKYQEMVGSIVSCMHSASTDYGTLQ